MVKFMQDNEIPVRQTYTREAPRLAQKIGRYAHAKQYKRMRGALKKLSTRVCSGLMEPDTFMRDNIVNHRGVNNDAETQLQAVPEGV